MVEPHVLLLKSEGKYNSLIKVTKGTDPSGMTIWVTSPGKEPGLDNIFPGGRGNKGCVIEKGSSKYQIRTHQKLQKQEL